MNIAAGKGAILVYLRQVDEKVDRVTDDVRDIKFRVMNLENGQAGIQRRLDRVEAPLDRIERRPDLIELPH